MDAIKVSITDPTIRKIVKACYPDYTGRKVKVEAKTTYHMSNYWDGGSRNYAVAYHLESGLTKEPTEVTSNPMQHGAHATVQIPEGVVIVEHAIFMGKDAGIRIYANPDNVARFIPGSPIRDLALSSSDVSGLNRGLNALLKSETAIDAPGKPGKKRLTSDQKKALDRYNFCLKEEDRLGGSVFANKVNTDRQEAKTKEAYDACLRLGMTHEHGL